MHPEKDNNGVEKQEYRCLNCQYPIAPEDRFCPECGQSNRSARQSIGEWIREFFASFLSVDSKFIHSITPLILKPGKLTEDYVKGKRARYIHPIRLYLAISILMFFVLSIQNNPTEGIQINGPDTDSTEVDDAITFDLSDGDTASWWYEKDLIHNYYKANQDADWEEVQRETEVENTVTNRFFFTEVDKMYKMDTESFLQYIYRKFPIVLFLFLPFFTLWLKALYLRKDIYYTEHLIFAFHTQTALFTLFLIANLFNLITGKSIVPIVLLIFSVYLYLALRRFYKQSHWVTVIKYILMNTGFIFLSILFVILGSLTLFLLY
jgi:hypothetical protein